MSAMQIIDEAAAAGARLEVEGGEAPDGLLAKLKEHKLSIVSILKQEAAVIRPLEPEERARPSWWPKPHPRIAREPPFGSDGVPPRYRAAWDAVLAQCPAGMAPFVWETAMYDAPHGYLAILETATPPNGGRCSPSLNSPSRADAPHRWRRAIRARPTAACPSREGRGRKQAG